MCTKGQEVDLKEFHALMWKVRKKLFMFCMVDVYITMHWYYNFDFFNLILYVRLQKSVNNNAYTILDTVL